MAAFDRGGQWELGGRTKTEKEKPKRLYQTGVTVQRASAWGSHHITYSYEVCNAVRNISENRLYLCAWQGSDNLGCTYTNIYPRWCQLRFHDSWTGTIFNVGGASRIGAIAAVHTQYMFTYISDVNPSLPLFEVYPLERVQMWTPKNASQTQPSDEGDGNDGSSSNLCKTGIH